MYLREQTVAIAVIGATGSGKSTFINLASGSNLPVCTSLGSCTTELQSSTFSLDGQTITLIDTPGFDDTTPSVLHVLKSISEYFSRLYSQGVKFAGVIYMHRAAEDRISGSSRHNFQTFCKFCGHTSLRDVVVVTDEYPEEEYNAGPGDAEEPESAEGRDGLFMRAVDKGARLLRHDGSQASAHAVLRQMIHREPAIPPVKTETLDRPADLACATAPADTMRELTSRVEHHTKAFEKLCQAIDTATFTEGKGDKEALQKEARNSLERIERIRYDLERFTTNFATGKTLLEDENQRHKNTSSAKWTEVEHRTRARQPTEVELQRAEGQQVAGRATWEREKMVRDVLTMHAGQQYVKRFACVAVIFALVYVSRIVLHGSASSLP